MGWWLLQCGAEFGAGEGKGGCSFSWFSPEGISVFSRDQNGKNQLILIKIIKTMYLIGNQTKRVKKNNYIENKGVTLNRI